MEWALRESGAGLATFFDGSADGLERFARSEGIAAGLHLYQPNEKAWNEPVVRARFRDSPVVLVEFAWRERGLIVLPGRASRISGISGLKGQRIVPRQDGAGSQSLLEYLLDREGMSLSDIRFTAPARTETDAVLAVLVGKADVAFGLLGLVQQCRLAFIPVMRERFDLLVDRRP